MVPGKKPQSLAKANKNTVGSHTGKKVCLVKTKAGRVEIMVLKHPCFYKPVLVAAASQFQVEDGPPWAPK